MKPDHIKGNTWPTHYFLKSTYFKLLSPAIAGLFPPLRTWSPQRLFVRWQFSGSLVLGKPLLGHIQENHRGDLGLGLISSHLHSKGSKREGPGRTRGRCGWVSAVTTDRAYVRRVPGSRPQPGDCARHGRGPLPSGAPRTRPLASGAPAARTVHALWPLPAAAHVVEPGAARGAFGAGRGSSRPGQCDPV